VIDGKAVAATLSIGMVYSDARDFDVPELLAQADQALYRAKERGRNRVEIATLDRPTRRADDAAPAPASLAQTAA
jgi:predicted signal transduction protein with EAL and GGDEF domain